MPRGGAIGAALSTFGAGVGQLAVQKSKEDLATRIERSKTTRAEGLERFKSGLRMGEEKFKQEGRMALEGKRAKRTTSTKKPGLSKEARLAFENNLPTALSGEQLVESYARIDEDIGAGTSKFRAVQKEFASIVGRTPPPKVEKEDDSWSLDKFATWAKSFLPGEKPVVAPTVSPRRKELADLFTKGQASPKEIQELRDLTAAESGK